MHPRIRTLTVYRLDGTVLGHFSLDPARRDLQSLYLRVTGGLRLRIDDVIPGSKRTWRDICVSALEAIGAAPQGWLPPDAPLMPTLAVGEPAANHE